MKNIPASDCVYVGTSKIIKAGRGVFTSRDVKKGEIIERCPIVEIPRYELFSLNDSILVTYFFYFGKEKERLAIALGFGSIYNHSYSPNAKFKIIQKERLIDFFALKNIKKGGEITVSYYNGTPEKS